MQGVHIEYFSTHDRTCVYAVDVSLHEAHEEGTDASVCYQLTLDPECKLSVLPTVLPFRACRLRPTVRWMLLVVLRSTSRTHLRCTSLANRFVKILRNPIK